MRTVTLLIFIFMFFHASGQFVEPKFGKIEISDLAMTSYEKDTSASALMLFNSGNTYFSLDSDQEFQFNFDKHYQIKIFRKSAFDLADVSFKLYQKGNSKETISNIKAFTYNLVNGKIEKTKLENNKIFKTFEGNYLNIKFAFPDVKEGSIIELSYTITSNLFYNLLGWNFQYSIPALWSQYVYEIPEYFTYRESSKGYLPFVVSKKEDKNMSFIIPAQKVVTVGNVARNTPDLPQTIKARSVKTTLAVKDVPAFIPEPNIDCENNYIQSLEFELSSIQFPGQIPKNYTQSWESVNTEMKDDEDFGFLLRTSGFISDTVKLIAKDAPDEMEVAKRIYNYVQNRMKWDGRYSIWSLDGLRKPYNDRIGNSSEINLLLTLMLQTAGLKANPVMFSTRENGIANSYYPTISKFNSVLTKVDVGGNTYLLDATIRNCPFGMLPANDINGKGRVVNTESGDWIDLDTREKYKEYKHYALAIDEAGKLTGTITGKYEGYAGIYIRNILDAEKTSDDYTRKLQENIKGLTITKYSVSDRENKYKPLVDTLNVEISDHTDLIGEKILFSPLLFEKIERNRYTLEERKYPVNYNYPISESYTFEYRLPSGYQVESLPAPAEHKLADNSIIVSYKVSSNGDRIQVEYKREINKILFLPEEYKRLKDLYDQIVKTHSEPVILKKSI